MGGYASGGALSAGDFRAQSYELHIHQILDRVTELVSFTESEHFALETLLFFWRNESRARLTVQTIGRLLGRPMAEELEATRDLLERALPYDIFDFSHTIAPQLFEVIDGIHPTRDGTLADKRAAVEQLHYAADVRQAVLQHVLATLNTRYQAPRFRDLAEASRWTAAYSSTLQEADRVIQGTRVLLKEEVHAAQEYLREVSAEIEAVEAAAEARFGIVKRLRWASTLEEAEIAILNVLAARSEQIESVAFSGLAEGKSSSFLAALAEQTARKAPKMALFLLGLASAGVAGRAAKDELPQLASSLALPSVPNPLRGSTNPEDTARFAALSQQTAGRLSARYVSDAFTRLTEQERVAVQAAAAGSRVQAFFDNLPSTQGRQTLVIGSQAELRTLLDQMTAAGYKEADFLDLLGLSSVEGFVHPLTLDFRRGQQMPIPFPTQPELEVTAPQRALPDTTGSASAVGQTTAPVDAASNATAPQRALTPNEAFIVYRVQPEETLASIAVRYGTTIQQVVADNNLTSEAVTRGQNLLIRRPDAAGTSRNLPAPVVPAGTQKVVPDKAEALAKKSTGHAAPLAAPAPTSDVVARYGDQLFRSLDEMPADARVYFLGTIQDVADFFNVRPGDLIGILRLEQNNAGWRLREDRVSSAGASGVAQIVPRTWNGWANPEHDQYVRSLLDIEEHGGLGFDWAQREVWRAWQNGEVSREALANSNADPSVFENSVAGVARHLVHWGLTRDFAEQDPQGFAERLGDAIAVYNSGRTLDVSADWVQSSENQKTTAQYVAEAMATSEQLSGVLEQPSVAVAPAGAVEAYADTFRHAFDQNFALALNEPEVEQFLSSNATLLEDVRSGKVDATAAALQLLDQLEQHYMQQGRAAIEAASARPWPYVHNTETLYAQKTAANLLGRTLTLHEIDDLMNRTQANRDAIRAELLARADARLFTQAKHLVDQMLERSARGHPVLNSEVAALVQPLLAGRSPLSLDDATLQALQAQVQSAIQGMDEYKQLHDSFKFKAPPLSPMPAIFKGFGVSVNYQAGGRHTGVDLANPRNADGSEPFIYAVADATVVHVGPLYCDTPNACRGGKAIVLDHGNDVYSIYSHNSEASVHEGDRVSAGQPIGRQGSEGFSYGSHLHFEVHTGAPFSGDWQEPFQGGEFVDPTPFLP